MAAKQVFSGASLEWQGEGVYPNRRVFGRPNLAMARASKREKLRKCTLDSRDSVG